MPSQIDQFRAILKLSLDGLTSSLRILPISSSLVYLGFAVQIDAAIEAMRMSEDLFEQFEGQLRKNAA
jgi:hypothetical protein